MRKLLFSVLGVAAMAALAQPVMAQPAQTPTAPYQGSYQGSYRPNPSTGAASSSANAGAAAGRLHDALHLTPGQEEAWKSYQSAIAPDPQQMARSRQAQQLLPTIPTPRRLALLRAEMQSNMMAFDRNAQAVTTFYTALNPDQQRTFDQETARGPQQQQ